MGHWIPIASIKREDQQIERKKKEQGEDEGIEEEKKDEDQTDSSL
jgi:hypothetical protein